VPLLWLPVRPRPRKTPASPYEDAGVVLRLQLRQLRPDRPPRFRRNQPVERAWHPRRRSGQLGRGGHRSTARSSSRAVPGGNPNASPASARSRELRVIPAWRRVCFLSQRGCRRLRAGSLSAFGGSFGLNSESGKPGRGASALKKCSTGPTRDPLHINSAPTAKRRAKIAPIKPTSMESSASPIANKMATTKRTLRADTVDPAAAT
jgi:hypothetical protein